MQATVKIVIFFLALKGVEKLAFACNGYKMVQHTLKSCNKNSIIQIKNITWILDDKCKLRATGCATVLKPFTTAKGHFRAHKFPLPEFNQDADFCNIGKTAEGAKLLPSIGIECPQTQRTICNDGRKAFGDISEYKDKLGMFLGRIETHITMQHEKGSSCYEHVFELKRA